LKKIKTRRLKPALLNAKLKLLLRFSTDDNVALICSWEGRAMGAWVNWGLVIAAIGVIFGDLVLEVYESVNIAVLGMFLLAGGILGLAIDSAAVGLGTAIVLALVYLVVHRRPGHMLPKHVSGH
jgi:hypothetical protein